LEGLPLAIELAASWFRVLSPQDLLVEIDRSIEFLSAAEPQLVERHRSMDAVLRGSWCREKSPCSTLRRLSTCWSALDASSSGDLRPVTVTDREGLARFHG
jgi:hypothetical protein